MSVDTSLEAELGRAFEQAASSEPLEPSQSPAEVAPPADTPEPAQPVTTTLEATPTPKAPVSIADDDIVEFKVGGQVVRKTYKELLQTQALLPADYTRKTQAVAEERRSLQTERQTFQSEREQFVNERNALAQALRDPKKIEALWLAATAALGQTPGSVGQPVGTTQAPAPVDPRQIMSDVEQRVRTLLAEREQQQTAARVDQERATTLESHVGNILTANPALKAIPGINDYLYSQVIPLIVPGQTTVEEAQHYLDIAAQSVSQSLSQHFTVATKEQAVAQSQLKNGIEPPGGAPLTPQPKRFNPKKGLGDDEELEASSIELFKSLLAR